MTLHLEMDQVIREIPFPGQIEDNADPAKIKIYDLARLKKTTPVLVVNEGDIVPFYITVFNQGNEPMKNIKVSDYIPADMMYSSGAGGLLYRTLYALSFVSTGRFDSIASNKPSS